MPPDTQHADRLKSGDEYLIREAVPSDVDAMFDIRTAVQDNHLSMAELADLGITPATLPSMLRHPGRGWVAETDDTVVGFAMANAQNASVFALFVRPGHEGKSIGRHLMAQVESWLFQQGCATIWLTTDSDCTVRANGFYRHLGWQEDSILDDGQVRFTKHSEKAQTTHQ